MKSFLVLNYLPDSMAIPLPPADMNQRRQPHPADSLLLFHAAVVIVVVVSLGREADARCLMPDTPDQPSAVQPAVVPSDIETVLVLHGLSAAAVGSALAPSAPVATDPEFLVAAGLVAVVVDDPAHGPGCSRVVDG